jgi:hypothetical protein
MVWVVDANTLRLLRHVRGSLLQEKVLHARFTRFRLQGEWFSNTIIGDVDGIVRCKSAEEWLKAQDPDLPQQGVPVGEVDRMFR